MALSDLAVYSEYAYSSFSEVLRQQIDLFNAATGGAIILQGAAHQGDFSDVAFFAKVAGGLVRRRNAYGTGAVAEKVMKHLVDTSVKVAAGTPPIRLDPGQFRWIQQNPEVAGAAMGQQLAVDTMADMLNTGLGATYAALTQVAAVKYDATGNTAPDDGPTWNNLNNGQAKFGDQSSQIAAWIMHSTPMHKLYGNNLNNSERLFTYGTVNVIRDPFGKLLVMTDSPNLFAAGTPNVYHILGLVPGAVMIGQNNDFDAMEEGKTGDENLIRVYQAEWSYNVGVRGFAWDKGNGGKSPTDAALFTSTNWDRYATSEKDLAGVIVEVH
ncbi:major head protein [Xanthomonas phage vB_Xar_IVIA-DoCa1]|uniref:Major head protein n=1 Tax=Xanthomonas phage vB_Xar_IVIA-DoCa1 TaxID=2970490 RepID=A0A976XHC5_9CAUD|nr:major head protein [Xanthomonas phage vB_Xar_IVIA-DoCa1]UVB02928.1 major head protein [Xanthomonas phage vB_Xar_IVIA-DoCa1]UYA98886.1 major head protein [Xanthomonas phage vB_Xar_IVIA-DoCa8]